MSAVIVIPARYASMRFPGKPLAELTLADGSRRTLIRMSWEAAMRVQGVEAVLVATDDDRIADHARGFGAEVVMTDAACDNGTSRTAQAVARAGLSPDIVVNLQGDAPLTPPWFVEALVDAMRADPSLQVTTPVLRVDPETYGHFTEDRRNGRVGGTTAVFDARRRALYFSKEVLPYIDPARPLPDPLPVFHHVGVYAYTPEALAVYARLSPGPLELQEGLEQLRFMEHGHPVHCVEVDARGRVFWELNNPADIARIEAVLRRPEWSLIS